MSKKYNFPNFNKIIDFEIFNNKNLLINDKYN